MYSFEPFLTPDPADPEFLPVFQAGWLPCPVQWDRRVHADERTVRLHVAPSRVVEVHWTRGPWRTRARAGEGSRPEHEEKYLGTGGREYHSLRQACVNETYLARP